MPFSGEIRLFAGRFAPEGWALCEGQTLQVSQYSLLFSYIGNTYGGDGQTTFNLPDLRGRVPIHAGTGPDGANYALGKAIGQEEVGLSADELPQHTHVFSASNARATQQLAGGALAVAGSTQQGVMMYGSDSAAAMSPVAITFGGGGYPHGNLQPYLAFNYIIWLGLTEGDFNYVAEIRAFAFDVVPDTWLPCDGRPLALASNTALFSLLGFDYEGGDPPQTYALPDLQGRVPMQEGQGPNLAYYAHAQYGGSETYTLNGYELAGHTHTLYGCDADATTPLPQGQLPAKGLWDNGTAGDLAGAYLEQTPGLTLDASVVGNTGGGLPHDNMQPYMALNFCIATIGVFPPRGSKHKGHGQHDKKKSDPLPTGDIPFAGELRVSATPTPFDKNWAACSGQLLLVRSYPLLFALIGTTYGGDGVSTFALPDLRGRVPLGLGGDYVIGQTGGEPGVVLSESQMPNHSHFVGCLTQIASPNFTSQDPTGKILAGATVRAQDGSDVAVNLYGVATELAAMNAQAIGMTGQGHPHNNIMPSLVLNVFVALNGADPRVG